MNDEPSITNVNDERLVALISAATCRVHYLAPGVSPKVATALCGAWQRLGPTAVQVILDVDPEVCRLGYGSLEGLKALQEAADQMHTCIRHHPGVRIGLLISDETTVVFSPTPLLIESGSAQPERPNAIQLPTPPGGVERDVGLGENPDRERTVGLAPVTQSQLDAVESDLASAPPKRFDLARQVRVFTSRFQFVELKLSGCHVSRRKATIPTSLVGLARDPDVASQFHAHYDIVNPEGLTVATPDGPEINEKSLHKQRQEIVKSFLIPLKGYGNVVLRANKDRFLDKVGELRDAVRAFQQGVAKQLQEHMDANAAKLVHALFPAVRQSPPDAYTKLHGPTVADSYLRERLEQDIRKAFGRAEDLLDEMKVTLVFKDIAYESLVDERFLEIARAAMPGVDFLHEEYDAARAAANLHQGEAS